MRLPYAFRLIYLIFFTTPLFAQSPTYQTRKWADSVFYSLSASERIAQLFVIAAYTNKDSNHINETAEIIAKYKVGGLCFFQNSARKQIALTNYYQSVSQVPLLLFMDAEWGVGMRLDSVVKMPFQIMLGAVSDASLVYEYAALIARQFHRLGMHFNYAPVVDINTNPQNPVINYRSFGSDKEKIALMGWQYVQGLQDQGILASLKHFPGHGDVNKDSHLELPHINKSLPELEQEELYPFRYILEHSAVAGVMIGHLNLPKIMGKKKLPSSISPAIIKNLLIEDMGFKGLIFTDALNMDAFRKYIEDDKAGLLALKAGNDMLCLIENIPYTIKTILEEMAEDAAFQSAMDAKVKKVLMIKYQVGLAQKQTPLTDEYLLRDLNAFERSALARDIPNNAITFARLEDADLLDKINGAPFLHLVVGEKKPNRLAYLLRKHLNAYTEYIDLKEKKSRIKQLLNTYKNKVAATLISVHNYGSDIDNNFHLSDNQLKFIVKKCSKMPYMFLAFFGNPYIAQNFERHNNIALCYNNETTTQSAFADILAQKQFPKGRLPFSLSENLPLHHSITARQLILKPQPNPALAQKINALIDNAITQKTFPGCVIMAVHKGRVIYEKAFGTYDYQHEQKTHLESIYDIASLTKGFGTTLAIMKLYEEKKLRLDQPLSDFLPFLSGTDKEKITIREVLLHESGLPAWLPYHLYTLKTHLKPPPYAPYKNAAYTIPVAPHFYMHRQWKDSLMQALIRVPLGDKKYVYSDIGFIFLGQLIEQLTQMPLDVYLRRHIFDRIGTLHTFYNAYDKTPLSHIAPTEQDRTFRKTLIRGYVHDYIAAMFGGVTGHAGLFSTAPDLALIGQMLLNGGKLKQMTLFKPQTINYFTQYLSPQGKNRRALGFDKPDLDPAHPYPGPYCSDRAFGHSGFTGCAMWVDPKYDLIYIFISNRIHPSANNRLIQKNKVREHVLNAIYESILQPL